MNQHRQFDIATHVSSIIADRTLRDEMVRKIKVHIVPRRVSVTDLVNLKTAYFRRTHPEIVPPIARQQLMWSGTGFHDLFGSIVSSEEYIEQSVECEGVVGRIDIFQTFPIEVKTTTNLSEDADLRLRRPTYLEQLGIYCGMVDLNQGKVVIYQRDTPAPLSAPLTAFIVKFSDAGKLRKEMTRRRDLLLQAIDTSNPGILPKCAWQNSSCEYLGVCDCATSTIPTSSEVVDLVTEVIRDDAFAHDLISRLKPRRSDDSAIRMNYLVFPRKAYFDRLEQQQGSEQDELSDPQQSLSSIEQQGLLHELGHRLKYGSKGEVEFIPVGHPGMRSMIQLYRDVPTIFRVTGLRSVVERAQLPYVVPYYFSRLGFECAFSNIESGRLVIYYRNVRQEDAKLLIYQIAFADLPSLKAEAERRVDLLATTTPSPADLPECPSWMCERCRYSGRCVH